MDKRAQVWQSKDFVVPHALTGSFINVTFDVPSWKYLDYLNGNMSKW